MEEQLTLHQVPTNSLYDSGTPCRLMSTVPSIYRLKLNTDGTYVLQGGYTWQDCNAYGVEWKDIPTIIGE